jgi:ketosteroid isomerase-like protein
MLSLKLGKPRGSPSEPQIEDPVSTADRLRDLNQRYIRASLAGDVAWYREHLADDFLCIEADGSMLDKQAFLQVTADGTALAEYNLGEVDVRIFGDLALVRATGHWTAKDGTRGMSVYTDVYVRANADCQVVAAQITRPHGES